jgi:hypothetical protein
MSSILKMVKVSIGHQLNQCTAEKFELLFEHKYIIVLHT